MYEVAVKIISLTSLFLVTFIAGILPLKLLRERQLIHENRRILQDLRRKQLISLSTCFAGGAFFASSMLDLIPVVEKDFKAVFDNAGISTDFPVAEFGISIGFFLILMVEQIIHVVKDRPSHGHGHSHGNADKSPLLGNGPTPTYGTKANKIHEHEHSPHTIEQDSGESDNDDDHQPLAVSLTNGHHKRPEYIQRNEDELSTSEDHEHDQGIFFDIGQKHQNKRHYLRSYLLLIALSVHALFEGLAVGLFKNIDDMVEVLGALVIHKCIIAFSIGINLIQHSFPSSMVARSAFLFSVMSPVGFGIGILLLTYASSNLGMVFSAMFQAVATGTFLYVTFFEIFFHELNSKECHKLLKVLMMILGYALIAIVQYFENQIQ